MKSAANVRYCSDSYSIGAQRGAAKGATAGLICDLVYWYAEHDGNDRDRMEGAKTAGGLTSQTAELRCDVVSHIPAGGANVRPGIARRGRSGVSGSVVRVIDKINDEDHVLPSAADLQQRPL
jgi:hypothetical protein